MQLKGLRMGVAWKLLRINEKNSDYQHQESEFKVIKTLRLVKSALILNER